MYFLKKILFVMFISIFSVSATFAQDGIYDDLRDPVMDRLKGKKVVFVPMGMNFELTLAWAAEMKREAEAKGYTVDIKDPNWDPSVGNRAITQAILDKPDLIVTQNFDVSTYTRALNKAMKAGIKVIQVNQRASIKTDGFVGADWHSIGETLAARMLELCGKDKGKSGKVSLVQGQATAAASVYQLNPIMTMFKDNPNIEVVSSQPADWDASKARAITQTVIAQNPDLCGVIGFWDGQDSGAAAAIKESGKDIALVTSGGGSVGQACDMIKNGTYDSLASYQNVLQGHDINSLISILLQSDAKAGEQKIMLYTPTKLITKENINTDSCWDIENLYKYN
jgi:ribose transport system substrate-binding protein